MTALILTTNNPIAFKKDINDHTPTAEPLWSESLTTHHVHYSGALFKTIINFQEYFSKRNLQPGASLDGGFKLMYNMNNLS